MSAEIPDNVHYIDEHNRERWLRRIREARDIGEVAVFNAERSEPAKVLQFPIQSPEPDGAA